MQETETRYLLTKVELSYLADTLCGICSNWHYHLVAVFVSLVRSVVVLKDIEVVDRRGTDQNSLIFNMKRSPKKLSAFLALTLPIRLIFNELLGVHTDNLAILLSCLFKLLVWSVVSYKIKLESEEVREAQNRSDSLAQKVLMEAFFSEIKRSSKTSKRN